MTTLSSPGFPWEPGQVLTAESLDARFNQCLSSPEGTLALNTIILGDGIGSVAPLNDFGTSGQVLTSAGSALPPVWSDSSSSYNPASVAITGGSINGTTIGTSSRSSGRFTTVDANSSVSGTQLVSTVSTGTSPLVVTSTTPVANLSIGGNAATATLAATATTATTATSVTNLAGGSAGSLPYQSGSGATTMLAAGTNGYVLTLSSGVPVWANASSTYNPAAVAITGGTINGTTLGATTAASGKFTTITASNTITPDTVKGIVGTTLADNAQAGSEGEFISFTDTNGSFGSGALNTVVQYDLPAGDWDVYGTITFLATGAIAMTATAAGISLVASTLPSAPFIAGNSYVGTAGQPSAFPVATTRVNVSSTTTIHLVGYCTYTGGASIAVTGNISARRMR